MSDIPNLPTVPLKVANAIISAPLSFADQVKLSIAELESAILAANPQMPVLLRTIHTQLKKDPEVVTLLSEEEIGVVVQGLIMQTNTAVGAAAKKEKASKKQLNLDDL